MASKSGNPVGYSLPPPATRISNRLAAVGARLWRPIQYSSAYLAMVAGAEVLLVMLVLAIPLNPAPLVVALVTFAIYTNDRLLDLEADAPSKPRRTAFIRRYRGALYALAALAYGVAVALASVAGPIVLGLALLPGVAWVAYAVDWLPSATSGSASRLKDVILVNSVLVAGAWAATVTLVPVLFADAGLSMTAWLLLGYVALGAFVSVEVANLGDEISDRAAGVPTLPVRFGVDRTRWVLYGFVTALAAIVGMGLYAGHLSPVLAGALGVGVVWLGGTVAGVGRTDRFDLLTVAAETARIPVLVAVAIAAVAL